MKTSRIFKQHLRFNGRRKRFKMDFFAAFKVRCFTHILVVAGSLLFLSSCSRLELVFDYAPRYVANGLEDSLDLSSARYKQIKESIEKDLDENRNTLLHEAIAYLDSVDAMTTDKSSLSEADAEKNFLKLKELQKKAVELFRASFSEVISGITSEELDHLKKYMAKRFEKADARLLDKEDFFKHNFKSFERVMDIIFGSVSDEQKDIYRRFIESNYEYYKSQIAARKYFMSQFELRLQKKDELLDYTMKYYAGDDSVKSAEHLKLQKTFFTNLYKLQVDIWNAATADQKSEFRKTLVEIKDELRTLIK